MLKYGYFFVTLRLVLCEYDNTSKCYEYEHNNIIINMHNYNINSK